MFLNCHTCYSFHYGTLRVETLLQWAQSVGVTSLALTDINNTSACLEFIRQCPEYGIRPVMGIDFRNGLQQQYIGLARNNEGFRELNAHLSSHLHTEEPLPDRAPAFAHATVIYPFGRAPETPLHANEYLGIRPHELNRLRFSPWRYQPEKLVLLQPLSFSGKADFNAHRLLRAIHHNTLLSKLPVSEQALPSEALISPDALRLRLQEYPELIRNTEALLAECTIAFTYGTSKNKTAFTRSPEEDHRLLRELCEKGVHQRYPTVTDAILERLDKELNVIRLMGFSSYFLINWDLVRYARDNGYFYVGRGSGANSMAAYCLTITDVDPIDLDLYFERFINPSRTNPPDFDIDFSWKDREDITRYIFERYGTEHTALLGTYNTFQYRAVIRELGKVFGLPKTEIDRLQDHRKRDTNPDYLHRLVLRYGQLLHDLPSHLSVHAGGILISERSMHCYTATNLPPKGYPLTQFSMLEAEDIGLHKFDILSQRGLGKIKDAVEVVRQNQPSEPPIDIHDIDRFKRDDKVREMLQRGETIGCFYVESPAMRMLLSKLEVHNYIGLVAASSIIRPGVAKSGMMREYILRHRDPSRRQYIHPTMKTLMEETYGIMVYQEDVIKVAHVFAGLTLAEADILRRGMSWKFKQRNEFSKVRDKFFTNCREKGYPETTTAEVWRQIESFGNFAFAKGHSASYAVESYQSLFLKAHYPREYMVAVINNGGGFYRTEFYVHEARMYGATIEPPCVNNGQYLTCIWGTSLYLGFVLMRDLEERVGKMIEVERDRHGQYTSLENFTKRVNISLEQLRLLIRIGAFRFTGRTKKELLWDLHLFLGARKSTQPRRELFAVTTPNFTLPPLHYAPHEDAFDEFEILGFPLCSPFALLRDFPQDRVTARDLRRPELEGESVVITGYLVNIKNTTTSRKEHMHFGTFLDRQGHFIDTVHFPPVAKQFPLQGRGCYRIEGVVTVEFGFPTIEVTALEQLALLDPTASIAPSPRLSPALHQA